MPTVAFAPYAVPQFLDNFGKPIAGGTLETYLAGTSIPAATYADSAGSVPNPTTIQLDSAGRPANGGALVDIRLDISKTYKFVLKDKAGAVVRTVDGISAGIPDGAIGSSAIADGAVGSRALTADQDDLLAILEKLQYRQDSGVAVYRSLLSRLRETVSPIDFGAKFDGSTDDSDAWQACIDFAFESNLAIRAPGGRTKIAKPLTFTSNAPANEPSPGLVIAGQGMDKTVLINAVSGQPMLLVSRPATSMIRGCHVSGLTVIGDGAATDQTTFNIGGAWLSVLESVAVRNTKGVAALVGGDAHTVDPDKTASALTLFANCEFDLNVGGILNPVNNNAPMISLLNTGIRNNSRFGVITNSSYFMARGGSISFNGLSDPENAEGGIVIREENGTSFSAGYRPKGVLIENVELDTNYPRNANFLRGEVPVMRGCSVQWRDYPNIPWATYGITQWPREQIRVGGSASADRSWRTLIQQNRMSVVSNGVLAFNGHAIIHVDLYGLGTQIEDTMLSLELGAGVLGTDFTFLREPEKAGTGYTGRRFYARSDLPMNVSANQIPALFKTFYPTVFDAYNAPRDYGFVLPTDTAKSIQVPTVGAETGVGGDFGLLVLSVGGQQAATDLIGYRAMSGPQCFKLGTLSTGLETRTGSLTGTTGTAGKTTVSAATDGKIYVENRTGGTQNVQISFLQAPGPYGQV